MDAADFRAEVLEWFGAEMERANPANVMEFVARFQQRYHALTTDHGRYVVRGDPGETPEGSVKSFLLAALEEDAEIARQRLWTALLEVWFGVFETHDAERFDDLFDDVGPDDEAR